MNKYKLEFTIGKTKHVIADKSIEAILNRVPTTGTKLRVTLYKNISAYTDNVGDHLRYDLDWPANIVEALENFGINLEELNTSLDNKNDNNDWINVEELYY